MYNLLAKNGSTIAFGFGAVVVLIFLISVFTGVGDMTTVDELKATSIFDFGLYVTIALATICAILIVLFGVFHIVTDLKGAIKGLIGIGALVVVFLIAYSSATPEVAGNPIFDTITKFNISEGVSKFVSAGIITTGVALLLAIVSLIGSAIFNLIK